MRVSERSRRSHRVPLPLRDGSAGVRRRRLGLRSRGGCQRRQGRGLRCGGARPVRGGNGGLSREERRGESGSAYALAGEDAEGFAIYCVASSEDLVEHPRQPDLLVTLSGQVKGRGGSAHGVWGMSTYNVPAGFVFCRCHRREFAVDTDQALERSLQLRTHHFRVHLRQHATYDVG